MISLDAHGDPMQQLITINSIDANGTVQPTAYTTNGLPDKTALSEAMSTHALKCLEPEHTDQRSARPGV